MALSLEAENVPEVAWEYWGWIETMSDEGISGSLYGLDSRRSECHERLCGQYRISRELSRTVTDHLDRYRDAVDMHYALMRLKTDSSSV